MHAPPFRSLRIESAILAVLLGAWHAAPAEAHKLVVFAVVEDGTIRGEVYFRDGTPARSAAVTVAGPDDGPLGETTTDEQGKFTFPARFRCDHKLIADAGEGHRGEFTVAADELPEGLPSYRSSEARSGRLPGEGPPAASGGDAPEATLPPDRQSVPGPDGENLKAEIEALGRQVAALRRDLDRYRSELRLQDVLGGVGYILGIMGLAFYFLGVRRKEKRAARSDR